MKPDISNLDTLLDQLYQLEHFRQAEIQTKGLPFSVQGAATTCKGLPASGNSYFFFKSNSFWSPGTILEQGPSQFVVLSTDQTKSAHDVVELLPIPDTIVGYQIAETGKKDSKGKSILKLQESHKYLQCMFDAARGEAKFFEFNAPLIGTILRYGGEHYRVVAAQTGGFVTTCIVTAYEVPHVRNS